MIAGFGYLVPGLRRSIAVSPRRAGLVRHVLIPADAVRFPVHVDSDSHSPFARTVCTQPPLVSLNYVGGRSRFGAMFEKNGERPSGLAPAAFTQDIEYAVQVGHARDDLGECSK